MESFRDWKTTSDATMNVRKPVLYTRFHIATVMRTLGYFYIIILIRIIKLKHFLTLNVHQTESEVDERARYLNINYETGHHSISR
jgi:hypothetical protein